MIIYSDFGRTAAAALTGLRAGIMIRGKFAGEENSLEKLKRRKVQPVPEGDAAGGDYACGSSGSFLGRRQGQVAGSHCEW
jgi:hypothetical protein